MSQPTLRLLATVGAALIIAGLLLATTEGAAVSIQNYPEFPKTDNQYTRLIIPEPKPQVPDNACLNQLWGKESNWEYGRINKEYYWAWKEGTKPRYACGLPQSYGCEKLYPEHASMEVVERDGKLYFANPDPARELQWGLDYIERSYGDACTAWAHWQEEGLY